jgi:hypothetical protein
VADTCNLQLADRDPAKTSRSIAKDCALLLTLEASLAGPPRRLYKGDASPTSTGWTHLPGHLAELLDKRGWRNSCERVVERPGPPRLRPAVGSRRTVEEMLQRPGARRGSRCCWRQPPWGGAATSGCTCCSLPPPHSPTAPSTRFHFTASGNARSTRPGLRAYGPGTPNAGGRKFFATRG